MNQAVLESKKNVVTEIADKFKNSGSTVIAEYRGLSVAEVTELRRKLREENVEMKVYKNTLASLAADAAELSDLKNVLTGPNALVFGQDETAASRILAQKAESSREKLLMKTQSKNSLRFLTVRECCPCCFQYYRHRYPSSHVQSMQLLNRRAQVHRQRLLPLQKKNPLKRRLPNRGGKIKWQS